MKMADIRKKAKEMGLKPPRLTKVELIRSIQVAEGNFPCFATAMGYCDQFNCMWREDCLPRGRTRSAG